MKNAILISFLLIHINICGQVSKNHKINLKITDSNKSIWSILELESSDTMLTYYLDIKNELNQIEGIPSGKYQMRLRNVFNDSYDTILTFDKRIGISLNLKTIEFPYTLTDSTFINRMSENDTLFIFYQIRSDWNKELGNFAVVRNGKEFIGIKFKPGTLIEMKRKNLTIDQINKIGQVDYVLSNYPRIDRDYSFSGKYIFELNNMIRICEHNDDRELNMLKEIFNNQENEK